MRWALLAFALVVVFAVGCEGNGGGNSTPAGSEGGACYGNGTCDDGLSCLSGLCVNVGGGGGGTTTPPDVGGGTTCGGERCPALAGHDVTCNDAAHCEYEPRSRGWVGSYGTLIWVPAGSFPMGSPEGEGNDAEQPQHTVTFAAGYFIDKYEVTQAAYASTGAAAGCEWEPAEKPDYPVVCVNWQEMRDFCESRGAGLCTEAEWEKAARGTDERIYPWGDGAPGPTLANCAESVCRDGFSATAPVGAFPGGASPYGALDMAGNVYEWVEDDWHYRYAGAPVDGSAWVDDPRGAVRVLRGGGWYYGAASLRASRRGGAAPSVSHVTYGARCCRSLD